MFFSAFGTVLNVVSAFVMSHKTSTLARLVGASKLVGFFAGVRLSQLSR